MTINWFHTKENLIRSVFSLLCYVFSSNTKLFAVKTSKWFHTKENLQLYFIYSAMFSVQIPVIICSQDKLMVSHQ